MVVSYASIAKGILRVSPVPRLTHIIATAALLLALACAWVAPCRRSTVCDKVEGVWVQAIVGGAVLSDFKLIVHRADKDSLASVALVRICRGKHACCCRKSREYECSRACHA